MSGSAKVTIHSSQFPDAVRRDLINSLRTRRVNHKFHYDSVKQTQKWLALHQAFSPSRNDVECAEIYNYSFEAAAAKSKSRKIHVIGLGCGGGQKDTRLLKLLRDRGVEIFYTPCDVSAAMTLVARETAVSVVPDENCFPFVCDLAVGSDLAKHLVTRHKSLITFFGMIPNFEPGKILPNIASLIRPNGFLLFSANLAPGKNYLAGVEKILPQYDNALTRDWLLTFLLDLGVKQSDGELKFTIETGAFGLKKIVARFHFSRSRQIAIETRKFIFRAGETIQLFFSYRYTPDRVAKILARHGLEICEQWITKSEEEGVFLCRRK
jgi:L-histidine N-alpha-methyltransferase